MDRDLLKDSFWHSPIFEGVQIAYSWKQLEHARDNYDFSMINEDRELLARYGKKLFIQLQDASFSNKIIPVPRYLLEDTIYHGGVDAQYQFKDDSELEYHPAGNAARRWDPAVQK